MTLYTNETQPHAIWRRDTVVLRQPLLEFAESMADCEPVVTLIKGAYRIIISSNDVEIWKGSEDLFLTEQEKKDVRKILLKKK